MYANFIESYFIKIFLLCFLYKISGREHTEHFLETAAMKETNVYALRGYSKYKVKTFQQIFRRFDK